MKTPRILIAPDKFKGSLTSAEVAAAIESGINSVIKKVCVVKLPLADGGDGFTEVVARALGGDIFKAKNIPDALGRFRVVRYGWVKRSRTAIVDVAGVCGVASLSRQERNPMKASSYGVGLLVKRLMRRGARKILIGLGGSATNDGGMGFAVGLGYKFKDCHGKILKPCGENLSAIRKIEKPTGLKKVPIIAAVDVTHKLLGPKGATFVFGPQKGATSRMLVQLENGMRNLACVAGKGEAKISGAGAAGGLGYAMVVFGKAKLENGFALVSRLAGLEKEIRKSDLVITGEGCLDAQTAGGKVPEGVRRLAVRYGKPVVAFVGMVKEGQRRRYAQVFAIADEVSSKKQAIQKASLFLKKLAEREVGDLVR